MRNFGIDFSNGFNGSVLGACLRGPDAENARISFLIAAIDYLLHAVETEKLSLSRQVDDARSRAAVTMGDGTDEYLDREPLSNQHQILLNAELSSGERRLKQLTTEITHFEFIKAAVLSQFPDHKPSTIVGAATSGAAGGDRCANADT
jgi:hypothetical protein